MIDCNVIRDLLPLYEDDALNDTTKEYVRDHLDQCPDCREYYSHIRQVEHSFQAPEKPLNYHYSEVARRIRRKKLVERTVGAALVAAVSVFVLKSVLGDKD